MGLGSMAVDSFEDRVRKIAQRAQAHGIELLRDEPAVIAMEKLLDRLDGYRDKPQNKGRILID